MDGGGGPTTSTVNQSNIPDYLRPQVESLLGGATKELFNTTPNADGTFDVTGTKAFTPYSTNVQDYVAGFSPLQQQVQANAANLQMPGQYNQATGFANAAGQGAMNSAAQGAGYGNAGFQSGQTGQNIGIQAGGNYGQQGMDAGLAGGRIGNLALQDAYNRANSATLMAGNYGQQGQDYGNAGASAGMQGGAQYGSMGAGYGSQAAGLSNQSLGYGQAGYGSGQIGQQLALDAANRYGAMGSGYGSQAAALAPQAQQYGQGAADIGRMGLRAEALGQDITSQARGYAAQAEDVGRQYAYQATNPNAVQQYMNPYTQNVVDIQNQAAQRQADIASAQRGSQFARAGAFGGARQAIENAEANRALQTLMNTNQAQGQQTAYDKAVQNMQYGANLNLQGLQGAQQGLGTALQGGQLGLSGIGQAMAGQQAGISGLNQAGNLYGLGMQGAGMGLQAAQTGLQGTAQGMQGAQAGLAGVNAANQAYQTGIQGAGMGLQGVNAQLAGTAQGMQGSQIGLSSVDRAIAAGQLAQQGANTNLAGTGQIMQGAQVGLQGVDRQLAGTAQGMQGAGVGLAGVGAQQAGYGLANQTASNLANIGSQQLAAQTGILGLQNQIGGQQQSQQQQYINQAIQNYANAQNAPMDKLQQYNSLLRGYAIPGTTTTQYQAQPTLTNQLAGLGTTAYAASQLAKKKGGVIRAPKRSGLHTLALRNAMKG